MMRRGQRYLAAAADVHASAGDSAERANNTAGRRLRRGSRHRAVPPRCHTAERRPIAEMSARHPDEWEVPALLGRDLAGESCRWRAPYLWVRVKAGAGRAYGWLADGVAGGS